MSYASVPPDFIDQKEKGISDQSEGEIDENGVFHCFPHKFGFKLENWQELVCEGDGSGSIWDAAAYAPALRFQNTHALRWL